MQVEFCEYDTLFPIKISDTWGGSIYLHKNILEKDEEWEEMLNNLQDSRNKYLRIKAMLNKNDNKNLFFDNSDNQEFFCKYLMVRFLQNYNRYKKEHPEWSDINEELAVNSFCADIYSMLEDSYKWFYEDSFISKDNNGEHWIEEYTDYMKSIMQSIL